MSKHLENLQLQV